MRLESDDGTPLAATVSWLLDHVRTLPRWALVCLPGLSPLAQDDPCLVVDSRELGDDEDVPEQARLDGLVRPLSAQAVIGVLDNIELQRRDASKVDQIAALNYFLTTDAFAELTGGESRQPHRSADR